MPDSVRQTPLVVGNWKMNTTREEANALVQALVPPLAAVPDVEVVVCPPFPWLTDVARLIQGSRVAMGAQNVYPDSGGAFTGEVSPRMLKGLCQYVLVGQYERRIHFAEKDAIVRRKLQAAQQHGLQAILCVGENADQLDEGTGGYVVAEQLEADLEDVSVDGRLVIAYDPVWTTMGLVAPPPMEYVADMVGHIHNTLVMLFSTPVADQVRVLYGGSVNPRNVHSIAATPRINGVLTGASSVSSDNFLSIVRAFSRAARPTLPP